MSTNDPPVIAHKSVSPRSKCGVGVDILRVATGIRSPTLSTTGGRFGQWSEPVYGTLASLNSAADASGLEAQLSHALCLLITLRCSLHLVLRIAGSMLVHGIVLITMYTC